MGKLDNKVAVVTGGSSGIGRATAIALAAEGASVAIGGRKESALEEVAGIISQVAGTQLVAMQKELLEMASRCRGDEGPECAILENLAAVER